MAISSFNKKYADVCNPQYHSAAGTLTFTAPEDKPSASLTLRVPGMVEGS